MEADERYGKGVKPEPKPLAQYLDEYIQHETTAEEIDALWSREAGVWRELLEQALDAYESTEHVKIKIEKQ